jgi:hypothetical protein
MEEARLTITDHLASWEVSERVVVYLSGRNVGEMYIDQNHPHDEIEGTIDVGNYAYWLDAHITFVDDSGKARNATVTGRGTIYINGDITFQIVLDSSGDDLECLLQEAT